MYVVQIIADGINMQFLDDAHRMPNRYLDWPKVTLTQGSHNVYHLNDTMVWMSSPEFPRRSDLYINIEDDAE